jgi:heme/copper-type cytochrome/quinol oxidase subunit 2
MENAQSILIIILSVTLTIFLIVAIVLATALIKFIRELQEISEKAHMVADNVEAATLAISKNAGKLAAGKMFMNVVDLFLKRKKGK